MDSVVTCRTLPWGSYPSSSQGPLRFFDDFDYRASLVDSRGSCVHVQVNLSSLFPVVPLLCCPLCIRRLRFNVLYHFRAYRVDSRWRTGHLQESLCVRFGLRQARWQVHPVSPHRARTRKMHAERKLSVAALSCLSLCGLFLLLCRLCCRPVKSGNPLSACTSTLDGTQVM